MKEQYEWKEIVKDKGELQNIVRILTDFDTRTGRVEHYVDQYTHYLRKAISVSLESETRIFVKYLSGFRFLVVGEIHGPCGFTATSWVHDDGIMNEREDKSGEPSHPVHSIVCLTDLYKEAVSLPQDLNAMTIQIMEEIDEVNEDKLHRCMGMKKSAC